MQSSRVWWHLAVVGVAALVWVNTLTNGMEIVEPSISIGILVVFVVSWFAWGQFVPAETRGAAIYCVFLIVIVGAATAIEPSYATLQTVAYPLIWTRVASIRTAILMSAGLGIAVIAGFLVQFGVSVGSVTQALLIGLLSFGFSVIMGLWISRIWALSDERQALVEKLQAAQADVAALHRDLGITSERERLAREIHDTIAQDLTGLVMLGQQSRRLLAAGDTAAADEQLALLEENARLALTETRALVAATAPAALDDGGIAPALERLAARFTRETGILVAVDTQIEAPLDRANDVVVLRCAQEALANVRKHSGAATASVALEVTSAGTTLTIDDDGSGFDPTTVGLGFGISGMRERLALVGGNLELLSSPAGTRLIATLPGSIQ